MSRRIRFVLWGGILGICVISGMLVVWSDGDLGNWLISVAVLVVSGIALEAVFPSPASLVVERQEELDLQDLIFYVYPQPAQQDDQQVPRDYLLQLHVAVANVGGRKAVLSQLTLDKFITDSGNRIHLPEGVQGPIRAHRWSQARATPNLIASPPVPVAHQEGPPFTLDPDDVVTLRFRMRRGVDWSTSWTLDRLKDYAAKLTDPIVGVEGELVYRRGQRIVREAWTTPISVAQQKLYARLFSDLTDNFTEIPDIPQQPISLE